MIITQFNTQVKVFHYNNGCEFVNQSLADLFKEHEILHQTCTYAPQQNSTVERKNRHILKVPKLYTLLCMFQNV